MRGGDDRTDGLFSYVSCEAGVPATLPLRPIRALVDEALAVLSPDFEGLYSKIGRPSILPEKLLRALLLQTFFDPLGTSVDGAAGLQPVVPLVCRSVGGRAGVGCDDVQQEPRPAAGWRGCAEVLGGGCGAGAPARPAVGRSLFRGRDADRGLGVDQELPPQGRRRRAAGVGAQLGAELPRREAVQRDPCLDDRSRRPSPGALADHAGRG